jgi:hypothetical protein
MDEDYKGHHIRSVPRQLPESRRWTSHIVINWTERSREEFRQLRLSSALQSEKRLSRKG